MDRSDIVLGHHRADKKDLARRLRREMTLSERVLWGRLRRNQLGGFHFRRQQVIDGFIVDFYCHAAGLVVEVDGPVHDRLAEEDRARERVLRGRGLRVLRFTNEQVLSHTEETLDRISSAIAGAGDGT